MGKSREEIRVLPRAWTSQGRKIRVLPGAWARQEKKKVFCPARVGFIRGKKKSFLTKAFVNKYRSRNPLIITFVPLGYSNYK